MTTHETRHEDFETADVEGREGRLEMPDRTPEASPVTGDVTGSPAVDTGSRTVDTGSRAVDTGSPAVDTRSAAVDTGSAAADLGRDDGRLFVGGELSDFHSRWTDVQSAFVDDPRDCVQKADALVADVVDRLTMGFAQVRARLEEQWDQGEQVSTEDLRIALKRYRDFFDRLLAV